MKTKKQKEQEIADIKERAKKSKGLIIVGFTGIKVEDINDFRNQIRESGGSLRVVKRRLLNIAMKDLSIDFKTEQFLGQIGLITYSGEISEIAGPVYKFLNGRESKIFGGFSLEDRKVVEGELIETIGQLPSHKELLAQVVGAFSAPMRAFMYILQSRSQGS